MLVTPHLSARAAAPWAFRAVGWEGPPPIGGSILGFSGKQYWAVQRSSFFTTPRFAGHAACDIHGVPAILAIRPVRRGMSPQCRRQHLYLTGHTRIERPRALRPIVHCFAVQVFVGSAVFALSALPLGRGLQRKNRRKSPAYGCRHLR